MTTLPRIQQLVDGILGLSQTPLVSQAVVLAVAALLAWQFERFLARRAAAAPDAARAARIGMGGVKRIGGPLAALLLVVTARGVLGHWQPVPLLDLANQLIFALVVIRIVIYMLRQMFAPGGWLKTSERTISGTVWTVLVLHVTGLLPEMLQFLDGFAFHAGKSRISVLNIIEVVLSIGVALLVTFWLANALERRLMKTEALDMSARVVLSKIGRALLLVVGVLVALPLVGIDITVLSVFGGALGVGLGLGLQKIASNYVSGFIILLDRSVRLGDTITVDNRSGQVSRLTTRYVVLKALDGTEVLIPNDTLVTSAVVNNSFSDKDVRVAIQIQVGYGSDVERAMEILLAAAKSQPRVLTDPAPGVFLRDFADNGILLELGFWISDPEEGTLGLRSEMNLRILREFRSAGIEIPFPQRDVRLIGPVPAPAGPGGGAA